MIPSYLLRSADVKLVKTMVDFVTSTGCGLNEGIEDADNEGDGICSIDCLGVAFPVSLLFLRMGVVETWLGVVLIEGKRDTIRSLLFSRPSSTFCPIENLALMCSFISGLGATGAGLARLRAMCLLASTERGKESRVLCLYSSSSSSSTKGSNTIRFTLPSVDICRRFQLGTPMVFLLSSSNRWFLNSYKSSVGDESPEETAKERKMG